MFIRHLGTLELAKKIYAKVSLILLPILQKV